MVYVGDSDYGDSTDLNLLTLCSQKVVYGILEISPFTVVEYECSQAITGRYVLFFKGDAELSDLATSEIFIFT